MVKTTKMIREELRGYADPANKIARMVRARELVPIIRGLYETDPQASPWPLAGCIYGPSYISFESALAYHGLIPEANKVIMSATFEKGKTKSYGTPFGLYVYRDVPAAAFPHGIEVRQEDGRDFRIASPEKALCDTLHATGPLGGVGDVEDVLQDSLRIDVEDLRGLDAESVAFLATKYPSRNVRRLASYLKGRLR